MQSIFGIYFAYLRSYSLSESTSKYLCVPRLKASDVSLSIPNIAAIADKNASSLKTFFMQNHPFIKTGAETLCIKTDFCLRYSY